jgi:hypothetical protein
MNYGYRQFDESDYEMVKRWNEEQGVDTIDYNCFPAKNVVVYNDVSDLYAASIYFTGASVAYVNIYKNPDMKYNEGIYVIVKWLQRMCTSVAVRYAMTSSTRAINKRTLIKAGFAAQKGTNYLIRKIY